MLQTASKTVQLAIWSTLSLYSGQGTIRKGKDPSGGNAHVRFSLCGGACAQELPVATSHAGLPAGRSVCCGS